LAARHRFGKKIGRLRLIRIRKKVDRFWLKKRRASALEKNFMQIFSFYFFTFLDAGGEWNWMLKSGLSETTDLFETILECAISAILRVNISRSSENLVRQISIV